MSDTVCRCLATPESVAVAWLHDGHCCLRSGPEDAYAPDKPLPCRHEISWTVKP